jgi:cytochrome c-type biogenesis protein CcmF
MFLTLGIAMGSYWAYYELGWGGFWFWDPVENASFMPWLAVTALLHSAIVMEKRNALRIWTVLLAILAFSLSLLGTFLVRSGVLTSVHTFAADPTRGVFILAILAIFIGGAFALFAFRAGSLAPGGIFAPISREGALILNNLFLTAAAGAVLTGTLYPLVLESLTGERISVGAPFFNLIFIPLITPLLIIVPFGPMLAWKRGDLRAAAERLVFAFGLAILGAMAAAWLAGGENLLALFGVAVGIWLIAGAISEIAYRVKLFQAPAAESIRRLHGLPRSAFGAMFAHAGVGVTVLGIVVASNFATEHILTMRPGDEVAAGGRTIHLDDVFLRDGPNYGETVVRFTVREGGNTVAVMEPTKRQFAARQMETTEAAIATFGASQLYVSLGDIAPDKAVVVRIYFKPLVTFIWLGSLVMALGGILSLSDRRLRVGAPRPARKPAAVPAE